MTSTLRQLDNAEYTVGWIAPQPYEKAAAHAMLDTVHASPKHKHPRDQNTYTFGSISGRRGTHNIVLTNFPPGQAGTTTAAASAVQMFSSFPWIKAVLLVGTAGGVPTNNPDLRLGDVVVSKPAGGSGAVRQYDGGKASIRGFEEDGAMRDPPKVLLDSVDMLKEDHERTGCAIPAILDSMYQAYPLMAKPRRGPGYTYPGTCHDRLFQAEYEHIPGKGDCNDCDSAQEIKRPERPDTHPRIHYGPIASGNQILEDPRARDSLAQNCLCFDTEAAGLMNDFPCLVIRGICNYCDTHKNDRWQRYAAATAAAYAKELLQITEFFDTGCLPDTQVSDMYGWLSPPDFTACFRSSKAIRHTATGIWFLDSDIFQNWRSRLCRHLWLHGRAGSGKTILSSTIIEHLLSERTLSHAVLYFFFDFHDTHKRDFRGLVISLVAQLYAQCESSRKELDKLRGKCENEYHGPGLKVLLKTFERMVLHTESVRIVIDGLDECQSWGELLSWIKEASSKNTNLQFLLTSRAKENIRLFFQHWLPTENWISTQQRAMKNDIGIYVLHQLRNEKDFARWRSRKDLQHKIKRDLMRKSKGVFLWAVYQLHDLKKCLAEPQVDRCLRSLPKTLDETYTRMLNNVDTLYKDDFLRILQFLAYSKRPLTMNEVTDAIAVDTSRRPHFDARRRMPEPEDITSFCPGLISVTRTQNNKKNEIRIELRLSHSSVKEYLLSGRVKNKVFRTNLTETRANATITLVCLAYLSCVDSRCSPAELSDRYPFAHYAANYWMGHAKLSEHSGVVRERILSFFLEQKRAFNNWTRLLDSGRPLDVKQPKSSSMPQYYVSLKGLESTARSFFEKGIDTNGQGDTLVSALQAACFGVI